MISSKVYVILINYRGTDDTIECLESLLKSDHPDFQVIVVDNSEEDIFTEKLKRWAAGSRDEIITRFPHLVFPVVEKPVSAVFRQESEFLSANHYQQRLIVVKSATNRGFAAANNIALRYILHVGNFTFAWLLNNDTVVEKTTLSSMIACASSEKENVGIWGCKLLQYYRPQTFQAVGGRYNRWFGQVHEIAFNEEDRGQWDNRPYKFDYVVGASMLVRKEFLEEVGTLEEDYFLYYEELDWAIRAKHLCWKLGFCPAGKVYHKMGASINKEQKAGNSLMADFYSVRNRVLVTRKYFPYALLTLYPSFIKFIINRVRLKQFSRIPIMFKILFSPSKHITTIKSSK